MNLLSFDLSGAEWNIVAYASGDERMITTAKSGESPHAITASLLYGVPVSVVNKEYKLTGKERSAEKLIELRKQMPELEGIACPPTMCLYQSGKKADLSLNLGVGVPTFAGKADISEREAKPIHYKYLNEIYPGVLLWHQATAEQLAKDRTLTNCIGRSVKFMQNWRDCIEDTYAFIPQSTVADIVLKAMALIYNDPELQAIEMIAQVHDELVFQSALKGAALAAACRKIIEHMSPELEYSGRKFVLDVGLKIGKNWSEQAMKETSIKELEDV